MYTLVHLNIIKCIYGLKCPKTIIRIWFGSIANIRKINIYIKVTMLVNCLEKGVIPSILSTLVSTNPRKTTIDKLIS